MKENVFDLVRSKSIYDPSENYEKEKLDQITINNALWFPYNTLKTHDIGLMDSMMRNNMH